MSTRVLLCALFISAIALGSVNRGPITRYFGPTKKIGLGQRSSGCTPVTCLGVGANCGSISNGCGGTLNCGTCTAPETCGGNQQQNVCGQPATFALQLMTSAEQAAMGVECGCDATVVVGNGGERVASIRSTTAMCTAGNWLDTIETGEMAMCPINTVRVMRGVDGSLKGVLSEVTAKNWLPDPVDHTTWTTGALGVAAPTVSYPDAGPCPDGTMRATRITIPAVTAAQYSWVLALDGCQNAGGATTSGGGYWRGYSGDGGIDMYMADVQPRQGFMGSHWKRIIAENKVQSLRYYGWGNFGVQLSAAREAVDGFVCFDQCETSNHISSYYPGTRADDQLQVTALVPMMSDLRITADLHTEGVVPASGAYVVDVAYDHASHIGSSVNASAQAVCNRVWSSISDTSTETGATYAANTTSSLICNWDGAPDVIGQLISCLGASCFDAGTPNVDAGVLFPTAYTIDLGGRQDNAEYKSQPDGIVKNVFVTSATRKLINLFGDSIVEERGIPQLVMRGELGRAASVFNYAVSGSTIDDCQTAWDSVLSDIRDDPATAYRNYMLIQCGTNSLGIDAGFITDTLKGLLTDARDAGTWPIWSTIIPRDDHCAAVQTVNATMRGWCIDAGIPYVETWANLLANRADPCSGIVPAYQRDSVHLNDAGETAMTELWVWGNDGGTWGGFKSPRRYRGPHWSRPHIAWSPRKTGTR